MLLADRIDMTLFRLADITDVGCGRGRATGAPVIVGVSIGVSIGVSMGVSVGAVGGSVRGPGTGSTGG